MFRFVASKLISLLSKPHIYAICLCGLVCISAHAQLELLDYMEKAEGTGKKKIGAEKSAFKNYTSLRAFTQNNFTYFNFYFNANDVFTDLIKEARKRQLKKGLKNFEVAFIEEDEAYMEEQSKMLDSIIVKAKSGVLLHDLRGKWIDDLLLLMGKCYYYKKDYEKAYTFFQYINNAYKVKDGYDNVTLFRDEVKGTYSIASPEKKRQKNIEARNDALIWIARSLSAMGKTNNAFAIINILSTDSYFPERLQHQLLTVKAFSYYQKKDYPNAAHVLETLYQKKINKRSVSDYITQKMLLIASLYQKGYRYQDAYRMYNKVGTKTRDNYIAMYAKVKSIGLDYKNLINQQVDELLSKRKFKKYRPTMYFELTKKLYSIKNKTRFSKVSKLTLNVQEKIDNLDQRELHLMMLGYFLNNGQYVEASHILGVSKITNITEAEKDAYNIKKLSSLQLLLRRQQKIIELDSLLKLSLLPEAKLIASINKMRRQQKVNKKVIIQKVKPETVTWYFDNNYLLLKGKQEFEERFGEIRNTDMWRNRPVNATKKYNYSKINPNHNKQNQLDNFINRIPTIESKRIELRDSLFYTLVNFVFTIFNNFENPEISIPYIQRALNMEISTTAKGSKPMQNLLKVAQLSKINTSSKDRLSIRNHTHPPKVEEKKEDTYYNKILEDFMQGRLENFTKQSYNQSKLSKENLLRYKWMEASSYAKSNNKDIAQAKFLAIATDKDMSEKTKQKALQMLEALE